MICHTRLLTLNQWNAAVVALWLTKSPCIVGVVVYSQFERSTDFPSEVVINLLSVGGPDLARGPCVWRTRRESIHYPSRYSIFPNAIRPLTRRGSGRRETGPRSARGPSALNVSTEFLRNNVKVPEPQFRPTMTHPQRRFRASLHRCQAEDEPFRLWEAGFHHHSFSFLPQPKKEKKKKQMWEDFLWGFLHHEKKGFLWVG